MPLDLKKPIVFFDLETTGVDITRDRIVEISVIKLMPNGEEYEKPHRVNPEMHIPEASTAVHGITDEM
ncbi:MAG: 3'-5' exonuclease, partial [Duncaniella sp.]|nr:3'-5' exonuclease [Duncaniella sp.]